MATRRQDGPQQHQAVHDRLAPVVNALGLDLDEVSVSLAGSRQLLRVVVDLPPDQGGALSLDAVADAAREISATLDATEVMGQSPYTLEVTSPGVERPLTQPRHLRRNVGRLVQLTLRDGDCVTGRVLSVEDDDALVLLLPGAKKGMPATKQRRVEWAEVAQGLVQVEFNRGDSDPDDGDPDDGDTEGRS